MSADEGVSKLKALPLPDLAARLQEALAAYGATPKEDLDELEALASAEPPAVNGNGSTPPVNGHAGNGHGNSV